MSAAPLSPTPTLRQDYDAYTPTDYRVWRLLVERQATTLRQYACREYLDCLDRLFPVISPAAPPRFSDLNRLLTAAQGWSIEVVPGFLPVDEFFGLLARRRFCSSTWLRGEHQLDYLEEPDMFHDIFGHIPLYLDREYAEFARRLGALGVRFADDEEKIVQLQRLYWFTIEFGVMRQDGELKVYGAGICSSPQEVHHLYHDADVEVRDFDLQSVIDQPFKIDEVQKVYYAIESFGQLFGVLETLEAS